MHLLLGGLALAQIGRRAGWPVAVCVMAAAVFMFGGGASARLQHTAHIVTYALFPLVLLLIQLALERRSHLIAVLAGLTAAALALGRNQIALLFGFVLAAAALAEFAAAERPPEHLRTRLPVLATMAATAFAALALPVLLTLQFAALSNRPHMLLENAWQSSLYPPTLALLAVPNMFGSHQFPPWGPNYETVPAVATVDESLNYLFVGVVPVLVVLWFGIAGGLLLRRGCRLMAGVALTAILYMLGRYTPFFAWAFDWIPGVNLFRRPIDASFVLVAALALITGALLADYVRDGPPRWRAWPVVAVGVAVLAIIISAIVFSARTGHAGEALVETLKALPVVLAAIAALALPRTPRARQWGAAVVAAIAVGELLWWNGPSRLNASERAHYAVLEAQGAPQAAALALIESEMRKRHREGVRPRVEIMGVGGPWQNLAIVRGFEATNGYNPLRIGFYDQMVAPGETTYAPDQRKFPAWFASYDCGLARALGLEYVVLGRPIDQEPRLARRQSAELLYAGPNIWVYRLKGALPRASFTSRVQMASAGGTDSLGQPLIEPAPDRVLIDSETPPQARYAPSAAAAGEARIAKWRPDRVEIDVDAPHGGVLVLHDSYYPGWIAEIDGRRTPIMRADVLFRAVEVPPGKRRVVFRYAPFRSKISARQSRSRGAGGAIPADMP